MKQQVDEFTRVIEWTPAFDKGKQYGIHGMNLRFVLVGPKGATQFLIYTDWYLQHNQDALAAKIRPETAFMLCPMPADLGYHSPRPLYDGQTEISDSCEYLGGKPCYYDGSGLNAKPVYWKFVAEGEESVWDTLMEEYNYRFIENHS